MATAIPPLRSIWASIQADSFRVSCGMRLRNLDILVESTDALASHLSYYLQYGGKRNVDFYDSVLSNALDFIDRLKGGEFDAESN